MTFYKVAKNDITLAFFKYRFEAVEYIKRELVSDERFDITLLYINIENNYKIIPVDIEKVD